jgi:hypothetical protein
VFQSLVHYIWREKTKQLPLMSTRFECGSSNTITPAELLNTAIKEIKWVDGSDKVEVSCINKVYGKLMAINECSVENSGSLLLQSLTRLSSLDLDLDPAALELLPLDHDHEYDYDIHHTESLGNSPTKTKTTQIIFLDVADGPIGLDLKAAATAVTIDDVSSENNYTGCCGGLQVTSVFSCSEFKVFDVITACNGVALTSLPLDAAIDVIKHATTRQIVLMRRCFSHSPSVSMSSPRYAPSASASPLHQSTSERSRGEARIFPSVSAINPTVTNSSNVFGSAADQSSCQHTHWAPRYARCPGMFALEGKLSAYTMYVCSSRKRAANRMSFDYIPECD